ncbi:MAG TPA: hypothetical protein VG245_09165 [Candidatus Dormibacteraeota bacterium]|jgi:hypothetical protein|nr:hypothetical protein [Candidatus Dormibacteraeota bacterium]
MIAVKLNTSPSRRALRPAPAATTAAPAAPRPTSRVRRIRGARFSWVVIGILAVCGLALTYVSETAAATQASYRIGSLKAEQQRLLASQEQIRYQISLASSAGRLDADAQKVGLVVTPATRYLSGAQSPVALARREPAGPSGPRSILDTLAVALGRPADAEAKGR